MAETAAERIAALEAEYARLTAQAATTRSQMLSDRLTRSRKEAQMREAEIEEAEDQAAYFEGRRREMDERVQADEAQLAAFAAQAAALSGQITMIRMEQALAAFDAALRGLVPQVDALFAGFADAAPHLRTAFALQDGLPESATETRAALDAANDRAVNIEPLLHDLRYALNGPADPADAAPS